MPFQKLLFSNHLINADKLHATYGKGVGGVLHFWLCASY